jgi:hypothetical protein
MKGKLYISAREAGHVLINQTIQRKKTERDEKRNSSKTKAKRKKIKWKGNKKLGTRNRKVGKQESKVMEKKQERATTGRRARSSKLDSQDDQILIFHQIEKIQWANSTGK